MAAIVLYNNQILTDGAGRIKTAEVAPGESAPAGCCCVQQCECYPTYFNGPWPWGPILLLPRRMQPDDYWADDCCTQDHWEDWTEEGGIYAHIFEDADNPGQWLVGLTWQTPDGTYISWDGHICSNGGALSVVCDYVAGALAPDFDWQTLNCADYPISVTAPASCNCYGAC